MDSENQPQIFTAGAYRPPRYDRTVYFGQDWTTHRFNEIAIKEKLIEQNKINCGVTIVEFDHRVVDARVTRHREIISTANHRDDIADHLGIPQNCAQQAHFGFDRDWWRGREECSGIASLRFVRKIGTSEL